MFDSIIRSKAAKGLVGILSPLILASGIYFSTPKFSHANPISSFVEETIDPIIDTIDTIIPSLTDGKHKTYKEAISDIGNSEDEKEIKDNKKKEIWGALYLKDGSIIKNVRCKDNEFVFLKDGQKLKIPKEKVLIIDFSKEKNHDIVYLIDGSVIKEVQYVSKNLETSSYLGDMKIDQDNIRTLIFKQPKKAEESSKDSRSPKKEDSKSLEGALEYKIVKLERLINHPADDMFPSWSPDGKKISFASRRDGTFEIYVMNADRSDVKQLTKSRYPTYDRSHSWSPDGKKIAFTSQEDDNKIYVVYADGGRKKRLTNSSISEFQPSWSPDGKKIAFASLVRNSRNVEIYVTDADGSNVRRLTNNSALERFPSWSPDSKKIAFTSERDGNPEIYVMDADGSNVRRITHDPANDDSPSWSPDGKKIAFTSNRDGKYGVYIMDVDGNKVKRLTDYATGDATGGYGAPSWSPDGKKIAFTSKKDGNMEIYVMYLDGVKSTSKK